MNTLYWRFQLGFWLAYLLLNFAYARAWTAGNQGYLGTFVLLSLLLAGAAHGLRGLYRKSGQGRSLRAVCLHLLWVLPLTAVVLQAVFAVLMWVVASHQPWRTMVASRLASPVFVAYSLNTTIILLVWCVICLFWLEWKRRQNAEREHWQLQVKARELELQFLRSQINSHFLFNTLNNIRALVLEDPAAARGAMSDLATLLRGVLQEGRHPVIPLQQELELVRGYLALEGLQLEERLQSIFDIDPRLNEARVPPLLLQTLVENAIRHGIARRSGGGCVRITASVLPQQRWRLQVTNPPADQAGRHEGHGIGLANVRERLRIAFANEVSLVLEMENEVSANVEMPLWTS